MKRHLFQGMLLLFGLTFYSAQALRSQQQNPPMQAKATQQQVRPVRSGEQIFSDNCIRCHMPPMTLNPRITGTIIMHMRTRARLSQKDQELLLKYLAP
jgi:cytochrome c5